MGGFLGSGHCGFISTLIVFAFLLLFSSSVATASLNLFRGGLGERRKETGGSGLRGSIQDQKMLGRAGSVPPRCRMKCGKCEPCEAVHVPVHPGIVPLEYYTEAWRCKCGNKIFMP